MSVLCGSQRRFHQEWTLLQVEGNRAVAGDKVTGIEIAIFGVLGGDDQLIFTQYIVVVEIS